ncbi:GNAT family N-acetyltransferase [Cellulophaga baltica]|uniref:GNAT family acetyltransferase n=1 Tax=Cellulophaga baltica 18 TaxID=1348584 RepID=A0AAU8RM74_9FLAO|nr:GNAT family N-acetyltransferase [Cellulophaga baltica]AIZ43423.1 GNAT family acetyltransferase [Cellulophaga baltica 18]
MYTEFKTERLQLRPTLEEDAELIYQLMNTDKFIKYVGDRGIISIPMAADYIKRMMLPQLKALGFSSYTMITKHDGVKIGTCGLYNRDGIAGIDIGFGLLPGFEGLGYAYEASHRILNAAFDEFKLNEVKAITSKENFSSQKLLEKLGLQKDGVTKLPNSDEEILLYTLAANKRRIAQKD